MNSVLTLSLIYIYPAIYFYIICLFFLQLWWIENDFSYASPNKLRICWKVPWDWMLSEREGQIRMAIIKNITIYLRHASNKKLTIMISIILVDQSSPSKGDKYSLKMTTIIQPSYVCLSLRRSWFWSFQTYPFLCTNYIFSL